VDPYIFTSNSCEHEYTHIPVKILAPRGLITTRRARVRRPQAHDRPGGRPVGRHKLSRRPVAFSATPIFRPQWTKNNTERAITSVQCKQSGRRGSVRVSTQLVGQEYGLVPFFYTSLLESCFEMHAGVV